MKAVALIAAVLVALLLASRWGDGPEMAIEATPASDPCGLPNPCDLIECEEKRVKGPLDPPSMFRDQRIFS